MIANSILHEHIRRNRTTIDRWGKMAEHRARVTRLMIDARQSGRASLCILGAGNANDVDLAQLMHAFERIVLVDLDRQALERAIQSVPATDAHRVELLGDIDLTGLLPRLESWLGRGIGPDAEITNAVVEARAAQPLPSVGSFDVVASTCVLTQLIDSVCMAMPAEHPRRLELIMAVRNRHLELIIELLRPNGIGLVATDFVSTETAPEIAAIDEATMAESARRWIQQGNFFTGANPHAIGGYYRENPGAAELVTEVCVSAPWRWDIGAKQFAVAAVRMRRRA